MLLNKKAYERYADLKRNIEFKEVEIEVYTLRIKRLVKDLDNSLSVESFKLIVNKKAQLVKRKNKCIKQLDLLKEELHIKEIAG